MEVTIRTHNEQKEQSMRKDDGAGSEGLAEEDRVGGLRQEADRAEHRSAQARATLGLCLGRSGCEICHEQPGRSHREMASCSAWQCRFAAVTGDSA